MLYIPNIVIGSQRLIYYPNICIVCFKRANGESRCTGCKLVWYCSKTHQKSHWKKHKELCKGVQLLVKTGIDLFECFTGTNINEWCFFIDNLICLSGGLLKRDLNDEERTVFRFHMKCRTCHSYKKDDMLTCKNCNVISYCSEYHKKNDEKRHALFCDKIKSCLEFDVKCKTLVFCLSGSVSDVQELPVDMEAFLNKCMVLQSNEEMNRDIEFYFISNIFSIVLTVIYAIEKSAAYHKLNKDIIKIHVVGSGLFENTGVWSWEYLFHYFKTVHSIYIAFIGPESTEMFHPPMLLCDNCVASRSITYDVETCLYHEFVQSSRSTPDVIVVFNCGFHKQDNVSSKSLWEDSFPAICCFPGSVISFTSYTFDESKLDLKAIKEYSKNENLKIVVECQENPFRSLMPVPAWNTSEYDDIYYNNNFINVLVA